MINMVYTDEQGNLYDHPSLAACGRSGDQFLPLESSQVIPLPEGSSLVSLPERVAAGWDRRRGLRFVDQAVTERGCGRVYPVGVLLPQGFTRIPFMMLVRLERRHNQTVMAHSDCRITV